MRLAYVFPRIEPTGGDRICYYHIKGLLDAGHSVDIYRKELLSQYPKGIEFDTDEMRQHSKIYEDLDFYDNDFSQYDYLVGSGIYGAGTIIPLKNKFQVWFIQNFDRYLFWEGIPEDIHQPYREIQNFILYSHALNILIRHYYGEKNFEFCNNGINMDEVLPFQKTGFKRTNKICYMASYNRPLKGPKFAGEIFKELKNRGYDTVSVSTDGKAISHSDEYYCNPSVENKYNIINNSDILIHTSIFETWGLVPMESMGVGTPVVGFDSQGFTEYANNENSVIIRERNAKLFCNEIDKLINNEERYLSIQTKGIETADKHDWKKIIPDIVKVYEKWMERI